jgi:hypothetical protein
MWFADFLSCVIPLSANITLCVTAASRSLWAFLQETFSLPACPVQAAGAVAVAPVVPADDPYAQVANDRSAA